MNMKVTSLAWESSCNVTLVAAHTTRPCDQFPSSSCLSKGCHRHQPVVTATSLLHGAWTMFSLRLRALTFARTRRFLVEHLKNLTRPLTTLLAAPGTLVVALSSSQWSCSSQMCFCSLQMSQLSAESGPLVEYWSRRSTLPGDALN